jgi:uncharacterized protein YndB with AHSA1/START domain
MSNESFVLERVFNAPREQVYEAWAKAEHLAQWWGPKGFILRDAVLDFRPGGTFHYSMQIPDGSKIWGKFIYKEMSAPERIVFVSMFSDETGNQTRNPWMPEWPLEILNTVTFTDIGKQTKLSITSQPLNATTDEMNKFVKELPGMLGGYKGALDKLDDLLSKQLN